MPLRVAAISFLNPAPLLYSFEHEPGAARLREKYELRYTSPAECAAQLLAGTADLGLIPVAALTPELAIVPGCAIASLARVRSILLVVKNPAELNASDALAQVKSVAADSASRSSQAYVRIMFEKFCGCKPEFVEQLADVESMLAQHDAALLIGDPALLALERRDAIEASKEEKLVWLDVAELWREHTGLPWVAAVWAVRPEALASEGMSGSALTADLCASRDAGLAHVDELVKEWTPRLAIGSATIRTYLTENIYYFLDADCLRAIEVFRKMAGEIGALPPLETLNILR